MKLTRKEKNIIINIFEVYIIYMNNRIYSNILYLCLINIDLISHFNYNEFKLSKSYLRNQKPTNKMNKVFYYYIHYIKFSIITNAWWKYSKTIKENNKAINEEKIRFLEHLIKKLKK